MIDDFREKFCKAKPAYINAKINLGSVNALVKSYVDKAKKSKVVQKKKEEADSLQAAKAPFIKLRDKRCEEEDGGGGKEST